MEGASALVGRGLVEILPDFRKWGSQLAADMRTARAQLDGSAAGLRRSAATIGSSMAKIGKGTSALGLGVAAVSVKMAADFQSHTAVLQTAAGETTKGLAVVREGIKNIAVGTGTGLQNLTDGMYTVEKAGYRGSEGLKVLRAAAQGAREEGAKLADVTNAMTSIMASYHLRASDSVRVMNAMKTAAGEGKITMEEFSGAMSTVLPIASANKISFEQVAGAVATLTQHGTSAREATHELGATIRALAAPNNVAVREMSRFGLSSVDVSTKLGKRGLTGTIELLTETILRKMGPSGKILLSAFEGTRQSGEDARIMLSKMPADVRKTAKAFLDGKIEADDWKATIKGAPVAVQPMLRNFQTLVDRSRGFSRELKSGGPATKTYTDALKKMSGGAIGLNTILQLSGESFDGFKDRVGKVGASLHHNTKDVEGWKTTSKLLAVQMDRVKAQTQVLAIDIGTKLIPVVGKVVGFLTRHRSVLHGATIATGAFVGVTAAAYIGLKLYAIGVGIATAATGAYNLAMRLGTKYTLGTRIQLGLLWVQEKAMAVGARIAAAAQWLLNAAMDANPIGLIIVAIGLLVGAIVLIATKTTWFQKLWGWIWGAIKKPVLAFVGWLKHNWQLALFTILTFGFGLIVAEIVRHWDGVKHAFSATIDWVKHNWPLLLAIITGPIGLAVLYVVKHWKQITKGAEDAYHGVVGWFVRMGKDIGAFFAKLPGQIADFFTQAVPHFFEGVWRSVSDFFTKLPGRIAGLFHSLGQASDRANDALISMGKHLIEGLWKGATDFFTKSVPGFFKTVWAGIVDYFKVVFGIHSPSTVMADLGINLIKGLFGGMLSVLSGIVGFLHIHVVQPIAHFFTTTIPNAASGMKNLVVGFWRDELAGLQNIWGSIKKYVLHPVGDFFTKTVPGWASSMKDRVLAFWRDELTGLQNIWGSIKKYVLHPVGDFFTRTIPGWASNLRDAVLGRWGALRDGLSGVWGSIKKWVLNPIGTFFTRTIPGWASTLKGKVVDAFDAARGGIKTAWDKIKGIARAPVAFVVNTVYNNGIRKVWNRVTDAFGGKHLDPLKFATGGVLPGYTPGRDVHLAALSGGEAIMRPEFTRGAGAQWVHSMNRIARTQGVAGVQRALGIPGFSGGGIFGGIGDALSGAWNEVKKGASWLKDTFSGAIKAGVAHVIDPLVNSIPGGNIGFVGVLKDSVRHLVDSLVGAGRKGDALATPNVKYAPGAGVEQWRPVVHQALREVGQSIGLTESTLRRMNQESGGNPTIVNKWDSNWQAGHPSVGLMQVIGPTFRHYAGKYRNKGPFSYGVSVDPLANIYASMRYALGAYGSLSRAYDRPGGYRLGTMGATSGWHWLGEDGPELAKLPAGTRIRSARASARQAPAAPSVVHLTVQNHGVIGSRQEVHNWLVGTLDMLARQRRLPRALGGAA